MEQKAITIYTPSSAAPHISAEDDAFIYHSLLGNKSGILGALSCVKTAANAVRLSGGGVAYNGRILWIPTGETLGLTIVDGAVNRVVAEFTAGGGDVADTYEIKVTQSAVANNQLELFRVSTAGAITKIAQNLPAASSAPAIFVQQSAPSNPVTGDLWFW